MFASGAGMESTAAVEAMGAYALFGEADRFYKGFNGVEFERCEIETLANFVNKSVVFRRVGGGILVEILVWVAFKVAYYSASEELHVALG